MNNARAAGGRLLDVSPSATCRTSLGKSGPPGVGNAHTSSSLKSGAIWWIRQGWDLWAEIGRRIESVGLKASGRGWVLSFISSACAKGVLSGIGKPPVPDRRSDQTC